jgi:hypothetical protein
VWWLNEWRERVVADWRWQGKERRNQALQDATAGELRRLLRHCLVCQGGLEGHSYASLAITVLSPENANRAAGLVRAVEERRWSELLSFQEFDPMLDAIQAHALRCNTGRTAIFVTRNPHEFFESGSLFTYEILDHQQSRELETYVEQVRWRPLTWTYPS